MIFKNLLAGTALGTMIATEVVARISIEVSLSLTGAFSIGGAKHQQGYQLCVDLINERGGIKGEEVKLIVSDNRSYPATAINQYERFIGVDVVDAVFGTFSSLFTFPVANILARNGLAPWPSTASYHTF
jgi:branched-chain amino acid transport system substrate-binding protein|tara:strand:+ start:1768 stop:2154 length:387 start_codon:yes stop_codon:yes gene_type:complete